MGFAEGVAVGEAEGSRVSSKPTSAITMQLGSVAASHCTPSFVANAYSVGLQTSPADCRQQMGFLRVPLVSHFTRQFRRV